MKTEAAKQNERESPTTAQSVEPMPLIDILAALALLGLLASQNWDESGYAADDLAEDSFTYATAVYKKIMERRKSDAG